MLHHFFSLIIVAVLALLSSASPNQPISVNLPIEGLVLSSALAQNQRTLVNLRIEGLNKTIFEGNVLTRGHNVTTVSGGTHHCDGTNNDANPLPGPTCTSALDDGSKLAHFPFDGYVQLISHFERWWLILVGNRYSTYFTEFDDFLITSIGGNTQTSTAFWYILLNFQLIPVGGCQQEVKLNDQILFAFNAFNITQFLKLTGPNVTTLHSTVFLIVTNGQSGSPVAGAIVNGKTTNSNGHVSFTFSTEGVKEFKALKSDSIRSNQHAVLVIWFMEKGLLILSFYKWDIVINSKKGCCSAVVDGHVFQTNFLFF